jgi:signal transduction histidine kinase
MSTSITRVDIRYEQDVVHARQRARLIAEILGFDRTDQTRISTAVSEIARNAQQYSKGGEVEFCVDGSAPQQRFAAVVRDRGPGIANLEAILEGRYTSRSGLGRGIVGSRRLMDEFHIESGPGQSTSVFFGKMLPPTAPEVTPVVLRRIAEALAATRTESPFEEIRTQNMELLAALEQIRQRDEDLVRVNRELTDTNTGMVALYTELEKNAEKLQQSEQMLRARNDELKDFAHTVSHDLKTPLRGIIGYAQELERRHKAGLTERARFCCDQILVAAKHLVDLVDDLLSYSRLDTEIPTMTDVDLRTLVDAILKDRRLVIAEQHVEVTVNLPVAMLRTWERGLVQVLSNLIDNAIKYSRKADPPRVHIWAEESDHGWRLAVRDNGIGFDMQYHDRIFGLFDRLVRLDEFEGTGAGLAIVKKVLDKMGGKIRAESAPGQGATFYVELPG